MKRAEAIFSAITCYDDPARFESLLLCVGISTRLLSLFRESAVASRAPSISLPLDVYTRLCPAPELLGRSNSGVSD